MERIAHLIRIRASPDQVYERVASTDGIAEWFTKATSTDYAQGGTLALHFDEERVSFDVTELSAPNRIRWRCTSQDNSWCATEISFEFEAQGDRTVVRFDHTGWAEITDRFRDCSLSWAYFLESLRSLLEEGRGTPESEAPACEGSA